MVLPSCLGRNFGASPVKSSQKLVLISNESRKQSQNLFSAVRCERVLHFMGRVMKVQNASCHMGGREVTGR